VLFISRGVSVDEISSRSRRARGHAAVRLGDAFEGECNVASSSVKTVRWACAIVGAMTLIGCSTAPKYEGATASFRSVSGYQDARYSYVGLNLNFAAPDPGGYHHPSDSEPMSTATASAAE
jgi:hypothetical protein